MGWFWGSSGGSNSGSASNDPLRNLNPELREFLAKESPVKYNSSNPTPSEPTPTLVQQPENRTVVGEQPPKDGAESEPKVSSKSLFQDGRYAKLWATYRPLNEVDTATKSDSEKINDILEGYKHRKAEIGRAALENCALEQWDINECFKSGGWASRMQMCRPENRRLERCYTMQTKFLKALGYLSTSDRPAEVEEKIQMHADTLYHRMLEQETAIEAARAEGRPIPTFPPLISKNTGHASNSETKFMPSNLSPSAQEEIKKRLENLTIEERELEEQAIVAEIKAAETVVGQLGSIQEKQEEERKKRKEERRETVTDKLSSVFRFR